MRDSIRFLLGDQPRDLAHLSPTTTVLEYLRSHERLCGTKEGCAEGDCGACTVALGEPTPTGMRYRAVNSCLLFLPALDGKQLLTVEHLASSGTDGHPVQRALVGHHASQCGFCTPGFVMALFAMWHSGQAFGEADIADGIAGNLCRCTGYRPIVDAARDVLTGPRSDRFEREAAATGLLLREIAADEDLMLGASGTRYFAPCDIGMLGRLRAELPDAVIVAGGTDLGLRVTKGNEVLPAVISVERIESMRSVVQAGDTLQLGAAATYEAATPFLEALHPEFGPLLRRIGGQQVRARGTIGGNIANASPVGDMAPALLALDTRLLIRKAESDRTIDLSAFFLGYRTTALEPGEFIERIDIPSIPSGSLFRLFKVSKRFDQDIATVAAAFRLDIDDGHVRDARIAWGGMAAIPKRTRTAEQVLVGNGWDEAAVREAMEALDEDISPLSDFRASADYRRRVARNLLWKVWVEWNEGIGGAARK